jgi:type IV secretory pathway TrbD component
MCDEEKENARVGYQVATNLMMGQSQLFWSKFNALVVANSIIVLAAATLGTKTHLFIASIFGLLLNFIAVLMLIKSNAFHDFWLKKAKGFEEKYFQGVVNTLSTSNTVRHVVIYM